MLKTRTRKAVQGLPPPTPLKTKEVEAEAVDLQVSARLCRYADYRCSVENGEPARGLYAVILEKCRAKAAGLNKYKETIRLLGLESEADVALRSDVAEGGGSQLVNALMAQVPFGTYAALHYHYARGDGSSQLTASQASVADRLPSSIGAWKQDADLEEKAFKDIAKTHVLAKRPYRSDGGEARVVGLDTAIRNIYQREAYLNEMVAHFATAAVPVAPHGAATARQMQQQTVFPQAAPVRTAKIHKLFPDSKSEDSPEPSGFKTKKQIQRFQAKDPKNPRPIRRFDSSLPPPIKPDAKDIPAAGPRRCKDVNMAYAIRPIWRDKKDEEHRFETLMSRLERIRAKIGVP